VLADNAFKLPCLWALVVRPRHYINRYDLVIYAVGLGLGQGVMRVLTLFVEGGLLEAIAQSATLVLMQMSYGLFMGRGLLTWLNRDLSPARRHMGAAAAFLMPMLAQYVHGALGRNPQGNEFQLLFEIALLALSGWAVNRLALSNAPLPGVDARAVLERDSQRPTIRQRPAYRFDRLMAAGNAGLIGVLLAACVAVVAALGLLVYWKSPSTVNSKISTAIWTISMRMLDGGNLAPDWGTGSGVFVAATVLSTLFGLIGLSSLIGIIGNMLDRKLEAMQSGRSRILERGHILFLGCGEDARAVLARLAPAGRRRRLAVVLMDDLPREQLEGILPPAQPGRRGLHAILRRGDIRDAQDLARVNLLRARHVVISGDDERALSSAMAVRHLLSRHPRGSTPSVSLLLSGPGDRLRAAYYLPDPFRVYYANDLSFAPILRTLEDKHFLPVYSALTAAGSGHELTAEKPRLTAPASLYSLAGDYRYSSVLGLLRAGQVVLHPPKDAPLLEGDAAIFLKSRRDRLRLMRRGGHAAPAPLSDAPLPVPERVQALLVIGVRGRDALLAQVERLTPSPDILCLDRYDMPAIEGHLAARSFDLVVCLGEEDGPAPREMDAQLLPCLLYIRELLRGKRCYLCVNLLDSASVRYAYANEVADYVLEDDRSRLIAADILREDSQIPAIEQALFYTPQGLKLLPALPLTGGKAMTAAALAAGLAQRQMLLAGWVHLGADKPQVVLNPNKNEPASFGPDDLLIVV